ncbi:uncharacterized protein TrAFT101_002651 [Trichoderma asperellum]|uniref:uncharacterized protein n=1 Tax=Trichoderma asperellum TaxID=101201 RepID=UPI003324A7C4|nr:hypothetical protein TrAFT101_002651 [Trichoderma asperellum]
MSRKAVKRRVPDASQIMASAGCSAMDDGRELVRIVEGAFGGYPESGAALKPYNLKQYGSSSSLQQAPTARAYGC